MSYWDPDRAVRDEIYRLLAINRLLRDDQPDERDLIKKNKARLMQLRSYLINKSKPHQDRTSTYPRLLDLSEERP